MQQNMKNDKSGTTLEINNNSKVFVKQLKNYYIGFTSQKTLVQVKHQ